MTARNAVATVLTVFVTSACALGAAAGDEGTVIALAGSVSVVAPGGASPTPLKVGDTVAAGATLRTAGGAMAKLVFEKAVLTVGENTELKLDRCRYARDAGVFESIISLGRGMLRSQVDPQEGTGATFQVKAWNTIAGVRGTDFTVETSPGDFTRVYVFEGALDLSTLAGLAKAVRAGEMAEVLKPDGPVTVSPLTDAAAGRARLRMDGERRKSPVSARPQGIPAGGGPGGSAWLGGKPEGASPQASVPGDGPLNPANLNVLPPAPSSSGVSPPAPAPPALPPRAPHHRRPPPD